MKEQEKRINQEYCRVFGKKGEEDQIDDEMGTLFSHNTFKQTKKFQNDSFQEGKDQDQNSTSSSSVIIDQRLKKIESDFRLVTSLYDDMSSIQQRHSSSIDQLNKQFDATVKSTTAATNHLKVLHEHASETHSSYGTKIMISAIGCLTLFILLRFLRL